MPVFIYINGYPGVGKLSIAKELSKLLPDSKVFDHHLLMDPIAAMFDSSTEEFKSLRNAVRQQALKSIVNSQSTHETTWIFTDNQSSNPTGLAIAKEYQNAASERDSVFISVILQCSVEENMRRATAAERKKVNTKVTEPSILRHIRKTEDIFHFGGDNELELEVSCLGAGDAAKKIFEHVWSVVYHELESLDVNGA